MAEPLQFTEDELRALVGDMLLARGREYYALGQVLWLAEYAGTLTGEIQGQGVYQVRVSRAAQTLMARCQCPASQLEKWCKHAVALCLAHLAKKPDVALDLYQTAARLAEWNPQDLQAELMHAALRDNATRERLLLKTANDNDTDISLLRYERAIDLMLSHCRWQADESVIVRLAELLQPLREAYRWGECAKLLEYILRQLPSVMPHHPFALDHWRNLREWALRQLTMIRGESPEQ